MPRRTTRSPTVAVFCSWHVTRQRPHHLVEFLVRSGLSVRVMTPRPLSLRSHSDPSRAEVWARTLWPSRLERFGAFRRVNARRRRGLIDSFLAVPAELHVFAHPPVAGLGGAHRLRRFIYDCMDDWPAFPGGDSGAVGALEDSICVGAHEIWVVSRELERPFAAKYGGKVRYVPNGVDVAHFESARRGVRCDSRPRTLGYVGHIGEWFDADLVQAVAERLRDWRVVLVGPNHLPASARRRLESSPNVAFRGFMTYDRLPDELGTWDVAMIPFRLNDLTHATRPLKLFEYLAAGLPVVATPMRELLPLAQAGALVLREDPASFGSAVLALLEQAEPAGLVRRAWEHDWSRSFDFLLSQLLKG